MAVKLGVMYVTRIITADNAQLLERRIRRQEDVGLKRAAEYVNEQGVWCAIMRGLIGSQAA